MENLKVCDGKGAALALQIDPAVPCYSALLS